MMQKIVAANEFTFLSPVMVSVQHSHHQFQLSSTKSFQLFLTFPTLPQVVDFTETIHI